MTIKTMLKPLAGLLLVTIQLSLAAVLASCAHERTPEEAAMEVAQQCYERLQQGDYEGFLAYRNGIDNIAADMRSQICDALKMYVETEERLHGGIKAVTATRAQMDTTLNVMQVFVLLGYGNGTEEEIVVPMVANADGQWRLK